MFCLLNPPPCLLVRPQFPCPSTGKFHLSSMFPISGRNRLNPWALLRIGSYLLWLRHSNCRTIDVQLLLLERRTKLSHPCDVDVPLPLLRSLQTVSMSIDSAPNML